MMDANFFPNIAFVTESLDATKSIVGSIEDDIKDVRRLVQSRLQRRADIEQLNELQRMENDALIQKLSLTEARFQTLEQDYASRLQATEEDYENQVLVLRSEMDRVIEENRALKTEKERITTKAKELDNYCTGVEEQLQKLKAEHDLLLSTHFAAREEILSLRDKNERMLVEKEERMRLDRQQMQQSRQQHSPQLQPQVPVQSTALYGDSRQHDVLERLEKRLGALEEDNEMYRSLSQRLVTSLRNDEAMPGLSDTAQLQPQSIEDSDSNSNNNNNYSDNNSNDMEEQGDQNFGDADNLFYADDVDGMRGSYEFPVDPYFENDAAGGDNIAGRGVFGGADSPRNSSYIDSGTGAEDAYEGYGSYEPYEEASSLRAASDVIAVSPASSPLTRSSLRLSPAVIPTAQTLQSPPPASAAAAAPPSSLYVSGHLSTLLDPDDDLSFDADRVQLQDILGFKV